MYRVALDILPMQASAVPCERVFSSSKETMASRRCNLSPQTMEILQVLKYIFRQDRLDFMEGLVLEEQELADMEVSDTVLGELLAHGKFTEALALLRDHENGL